MRTHVIRCLALPVAAFILLPVTGVASAEPTCEAPTAYEQLVTTPPPDTGPVSVPVVVHIMERPGQDCEVRALWTTDALRLVFGPNQADAQSVTSIWGPHVRFVIRDVVLHRFDPPRALIDDNGDMKVPLTGPLGSPEWEAAYRDLMTQFHRTGMVNVYLWRFLADRAGYGRSRSGGNKSTVWLGVSCTLYAPESCARLVAHELGHALGLYHPPPSKCGPVQREFRQLCRRLASACLNVTLGERLMHSGGAGRKLCPVEVREAQQMATQLQ